MMAYITGCIISITYHNAIFSKLQKNDMDKFNSTFIYHGLESNIVIFLPRLSFLTPLDHTNSTILQYGGKKKDTPPFCPLMERFKCNNFEVVLLLFLFFLLFPSTANTSPVSTTSSSIIFVSILSFSLLLFVFFSNATFDAVKGCA